MEIRKRKNGVSFREKVYLPNGQSVTKTFNRKTDAIAWKHRVSADAQRGVAIGLKKRRAPPFEELVESWLDRKVRPFKAEKTIYEYSSISRRHLIPRLKKERVESLSAAFADQLVIELRRSGSAPRRINKILGVLKLILRFAKAEGHIQASPLQGYPQLKVSPRKDTYLLSKEIDQLLRVTHGEPFHAVLLVALNTGMRIGELCGLCWDRVNFGTRQIEVTRTMDRKRLKETTKTNMIRYVPMNLDVEKHLRDLSWQQRHMTFVFVDHRLEPYNPDHVSGRQLQRALERAHVRKVRFHDLRHTYASHFMQNGGNLYDLQKILGHTKIEMTQRYSHLSPTHLLSVANTVRFSHEGNLGSSPFSAPREDSNLQVIGK